MNESNLLDGIDDVKEVSDDEAYALSKQMWFDVIGENEYSVSATSIMSYVNNLGFIPKRGNGFSYEIANNSSGTFVAAVWMMASMRQTLNHFIATPI